MDYDQPVQFHPVKLNAEFVDKIFAGVSACADIHSFIALKKSRLFFFFFWYIKMCISRLIRLFLILSKEKRMNETNLFICDIIWNWKEIRKLNLWLNDFEKN